MIFGAKESVRLTPTDDDKPKNTEIMSFQAGSHYSCLLKVLGWYYRSVNDRTPSWSGVEYLYNFLTNNRSIGPYGHIVSQSEAMPGDIVQLGTFDGDFYHSPVITDIIPQILVAAHSYDTVDRPLYSYSFAKVRFIHIDAVRVW